MESGMAENNGLMLTDQTETNIYTLILFFIKWKVIFILFIIFGLSLGLVSHFLSKTYLTKISLESNPTDYNITDNVGKLNLNLAALFSQQKDMHIFATKFYEHVYKKPDSDDVINNQLEKIIKFLDLIKYQPQEKNKIIQSLEKTLGRKQFFDLEFGPNAQWQLVFRIEDKNIATHISYAFIKALNETIISFNENKRLQAEHIKILAFSQAKEKINQLSPELNNLVNAQNAAKSAFLKSFNALKKEAEDKNIKLDLQQNIYNKINRVFISEQDSAKLVNQLLYLEISSFSEQLFSYSSHNPHIDVSKMIEKLEKLKIDLEDLIINRNMISSTKESSNNSLRLLLEDIIKPVEIKDVGIRTVNINWDVLSEELDQGQYTVKVPKLILSTSVGVFSGFIMALMVIFFIELRRELHIKKN